MGKKTQKANNRGRTITPYRREDKRQFNHGLQGDALSPLPCVICHIVFPPKIHILKS